MTYAETHDLVKAIEQIDTFASSIAREYEEKSIDYDRMAMLEKYLQEAKEKVFNIAKK